METQAEATQATIQTQPVGQAMDAPESAQQSINAILASVLESVDERGELKETQEPAKEETKPAATAEVKTDAKAEDKPEQPKESAAKLVAAAVRREREANEKMAKADKLAKEAAAKEERYAKIEAAFKGKNYGSFLKLIDPTADLNAFVLEALETLGKDETPMTQEELRAHIRAEMESEFRQRQEAEKAEKQRLIDEAKKNVDQAFAGYVGECEQFVTANAEEYPILSSPRQFEKAKADMLAFAEEMFARHQRVPSHKDLLDQVEKELAADMVEKIKNSKKYGWQQPGQQRPAASPTITPRMTSYEQGVASPGSARERSLAEEMAEIQASIAQRFGA